MPWVVSNIMNFEHYLEATYNKFGIFYDAVPTQWPYCALQNKNALEQLLGNHVKKIQIDAQLIPSIFRQHLHISGVSRPIIRRYNPMNTTFGTFGTYYYF